MFKGGYTITVSTDQVRHAAGAYQAIADDVYSQREQFSHTGRLDAATGKGEDEIHLAFNRDAWGSLSRLCNLVSEVAHRMKYINNGLRAMADSHEDNEEAAQRRLEHVLDHGVGVQATMPKR